MIGEEAYRERIAAHKAAEAAAKPTPEQYEAIIRDLEARAEEQAAVYVETFGQPDHAALRAHELRVHAQHVANCTQEPVLLQHGPTGQEETFHPASKPSSRGGTFQIDGCEPLPFKAPLSELRLEMKPSNPKDAIGSTKAPLSVLPFPPLYEVAAGMLEGACKYRRHNYRAIGVRASVYFDAAMRHLTSWWEGEDIDPASGIHHVSKAIAGLLVARDSMLQGNFHDDRPPRGPENWEGNVQGLVDVVLQRCPDPLPPYTHEGVMVEALAALENEAVSSAFRVEVQLPADDYAAQRWTASAVRGLDEERALRHAESLRRERGNCPVRVMRGNELVALALPGDPPLCALGSV